MNLWRRLTRVVGVVAVALLAGAGSRGSVARASLPAPRDSALTIIFFDVGQGDAALIIAPSGRKVLVDAGPSRTAVAKLLRAMSIDTLDLVVASHNHADHMGGMAAVINSVVVRNYLENGMPQTTRTYGNVVTALERRGVPVLRATARRIDLGLGVTVRVLVWPSSATTQNNRSVGLLVTYGKFSALFTGDAEGAERAFWDDSAGIGRVAVLKVAHHGSVNGTDARFLAVVHPCVAVISVGNPNKFGHPSAAVIGLLRADSVRVYRTDVGGPVTVVATPDGRMAVSRGAAGGAANGAAERPMCAATPSPGR